MKRVYDFDSYREFVRETIREMPNKGRGELLKLAAAVGIHTSTLSQVLSGQKDFTLEQAQSATEFFGIDQNASRYLLTLVSRDRAGTVALRKSYERDLREMKTRSKDLRSVLIQDRPLTDAEIAVFYSNWYYTAIWAQTSIEGFGHRESLQRHFGLKRKLVNDVVSFLLSSGLLVEAKGKLAPGHQYTHLEASSPFISRHHANWRVKAMEKHPHLSDQELSYTSPMTLSVKDAETVQSAITDLIAKINKIRDPSPCEAQYCLNVDWFQI